MDIKQRKNEHIEICLKQNVEYSYNFWNDVVLEHYALPEFDKEEVSTRTSLLGKELSAPFLIGAMSGGTELAEHLNSTLAKVASELKIGLCVGSQRPILKLRNDENVLRSYEVIKEYDIPIVIGNIGAPQIPKLADKDLDILFESIGADFLAIHLNFPQEMIQPEGDSNARGILEKIREISSSYPIIVKEVGFGISREVASKLKDAGVKAIDVAGTSGTNWIAVEYFRAKNRNLISKEKLAKTFWDWGIPAPLCILECKDLGMPLIASSGIRNGLDIAKALVLGASCVSMARPLLKNALEGEERLKEQISSILEELKVAMFLTNCKEIKDLRKVKYWIVGKLREFCL